MSRRGYRQQRRVSLDATGSVAPAWTPNKLTGLLAHYTADSVTQSGGAVSALLDVSGNGNTAPALSGYDGAYAATGGLNGTAAVMQAGNSVFQTPVLATAG